MDILNGHKYIPGFLSVEESEHGAWILVLQDKKLLMKKIDNKFYIPNRAELTDILPRDGKTEYIGYYDDHDCYSIRLNELPIQIGNLELVDFNKITDSSGDPGLFILAGAANHILHWNSVNLYCGRCGHETSDKKDERVKVCTNCGNLIYPRISPATITAIFREDQILLAHNRNFGHNLYSLIAGFVEPGETLEQCVEREIQEEVGIRVKNVKYFGSQPWSFPDSLMMAFTAEYESGEIVVDNNEILDAGWYNADCLPTIPSTDSVAGKIIHWYRDQFIK